MHPRLIKDGPQVADNLTCGEQLSKYSALKCQADVGSVCFDCSGQFVQTEVTPLDLKFEDEL